MSRRTIIRSAIILYCAVSTGCIVDTEPVRGETGQTGPQGPPGDAPPTDPLDVTTVGARGDGATDDTNALAAAVESSASLYFPPGEYLVDQLLLAPGSLILAAPGAILKGNGGVHPYPVLTLASGSRVDGLEIDGNSASRKQSPSCVRAENGANVTIQGVFVHDCTASGIQFLKATDFRCESSQVQRCGDGISVVESSGVITDNNLKNISGACITTSYTGDLLITQNHIDTCKNTGINLENSPGALVESNLVRSAITTAIAIRNSDNVTVSSNNLDQNDGGEGISLLEPGKSSVVSLIGNMISASLSHGVRANSQTAEALLVNNNTIVVSGKPAGIFIREVGTVAVVGNLIGVAGPTGIALEGSSNSLVSDNRIDTDDVATNSVGEYGGIFLYYRSAQYPAKGNTVLNNVLSGFFVAVNDDCWGDIKSANWIESNRVGGAIVRRAGNGWNGVVIDNHSLADPTVLVDATTY